MKKIVSLIPARGGSKSIKRKNIVDLNGLPLLAYSIIASYGAVEVQETWVSTDDKGIRSVAWTYGAKVIMRPREISGDDSPIEEAIEHFLENVRCDIVVLIQPTSPLIVSEDIDRGLGVFLEGKYDSLFSATRAEDMLFWIERKNLRPLNYDPRKRKERQTRGKNPVLIETGGFYIFTKEIFMKYKNRLSRRIGYIEIPYWRSFEVDSSGDLKNIAQLMRG